MKEITKVGELKPQETMTSLQIADATGKAHKNVCRDIKVILDQGVDRLNFELTSYVDKSNRNQHMYRLTKKGCLILASGYDALLREKVISRWEELESKQLKALPGNYLDALKALVESEEQKQALFIENEEMKPKAELAELRIEKKGCYSITDATKALGLKRGDITNWAKQEGYIHKKLQEVNKKGERFFKVHSSDQVHNQIGVTEEGLKEARKMLCANKFTCGECKWIRKPEDGTSFRWCDRCMHATFSDTIACEIGFSKK